MFVKNAGNDDLAQVLEIKELTDPHSATVRVRYQAGEEVGDPVAVEKSSLVFPSGEALPQCWLDPHYRVQF